MKLLLGILALLAACLPARAEETPKKGGIFTFMIPADAPPSLDGHKENTYATLHATAPFYSTLIAINPDNPSSSTDFVCDLCTEMPPSRPISSSIFSPEWPKPTEAARPSPFRSRRA